MQVFVRSPLRRGDAPKSIACSPCGRASGRLCFLFSIFGFFRIVRFYRQRASRQVSLRKVTKSFRKNYGKMSKSCGGFPSDKKVCEYFRRRNTVAFTPYMGSFRHVRRFVGSRFSSSILTGRPSETSVRRLGCSALPLDPRARTFREETGNFDLLCPRTRRKVRGHFFREFSGFGSDFDRPCTTRGGLRSRNACVAILEACDHEFESFLVLCSTVCVLICTICDVG